MTRFLLAILLHLGLGAAASADQYTNERGLCRAFAADGVIAAAPGNLKAIYIAGVEAGDDFLIYDDAAAATGTVIFNQTNLAAGDKQFPNVPGAFGTGAYLDVTAADATAAFTLTVCYALY